MRDAHRRDELIKTENTGRAKILCAIRAWSMLELDTYSRRKSLTSIAPAFRAADEVKAI
jgi:hypothetical protein